MPPLLWATAQSKKVQNMLKSRDQILIKHACRRGLRYLAFSIILVSLRVEVAQISDFLVHAKTLPL